MEGGTRTRCHQNSLDDVIRIESHHQDGTGESTGGIVNRRGRGKARVVSPFMGRDVCPGREPDCLKPAGTGVGVSSCIYDSNSLGDRAKEGRGSERRHAGTGEGTLAYMWQIHMETEPRRVAEAIAGTAQIRCGRGLTSA